MECGEDSARGATLRSIHFVWGGGTDHCGLEKSCNWGGGVPCPTWQLASLDHGASAGPLWMNQLSELPFPDRRSKGGCGERGPRDRVASLP